MKILITGGAGFIGCNLAHACIAAGERVTLLDNLSRRGSPANLQWLRDLHGERAFDFIRADIRDAAAMVDALRGYDAIYHLAAQTAVTTSVTDPRTDFEINALGTFNVLEAVRASAPDAIVIYSSTNKVYGGMEDAPAEELATRYILPDYPHGVGEDRPLDFHSPYGCSKGAADQYVRDYSRIYGLRSVVFRQSCLEGAAQVRSSHGSYAIRDIAPDAAVWSVNGDAGISQRPFTGPYSPPLNGRKLLRLTTARGYEIRATDDHRFLTPGGYLPLSQVQYGGLVAVAPQAQHQVRPAPCVFPPQQVLDEAAIREVLAECGRRPEYNDEVVAELKSLRLLPLTLDHPLIYIVAQLVGYLTGDGHLYRHFKPSRGKIDLGIQAYALGDELEAIKDDFRALGFRPGKTMISTSRSDLPNGHVIDGMSYKFPVYSSAAFAFFAALGVPIGRKADIPFGVPEWVLAAPEPVQDAYLAGLFGAEMTAPSFYRRAGDEGGGEFQSPAFAQAKALPFEQDALAFRQQITDLLGKRGIKTRPYQTDFHYRKGGDRSRSYQFNVLSGKENLARFARIGYAYNVQRNIKLYRAVEFMKTRLPYSCFDQWVAEHTQGLPAPDLLWDRVSAKQETPLQLVYDITVPETHNFIANGFVVHNCIYGQRQMGVEDQGWVAWFVIAAVTGKNITIYGNGKQVRDLLHVDDLTRAFRMATEKIDITRGQVYNLGGGPANTLSIWAEFGPLLKELVGKEIVPAGFADWRPGDQPVFIADVSKAGREWGWQPEVSVREGITRLVQWVRENRELFA